MKADLHIHSNYSDGTYAPKIILNKVKRKGLSVFSITDHETVAGVLKMEQILKNEKNDIVFFSGIELDCKNSDVKSFDILGYGFDAKAGTINALVNECSAKRKVKLEELLKFLFLRYAISFTDEQKRRFRELEFCGKPHLALAILENGYEEDIETVFKKYLDKFDSAKYKLADEEVISAIDEAGGIACLAHPKLIMTKFKKDYEFIENFIISLKDKGLRAIEVYHSSHTKEDVARFLDIAKRNEMLVAGGSDFHGKVKPKVKIGMLTADKTLESELTIINELEKTLDK